MGLESQMAQALISPSGTAGPGRRARGPGTSLPRLPCPRGGGLSRHRAQLMRPACGPRVMCERGNNKIFMGKLCKKREEPEYASII